MITLSANVKISTHFYSAYEAANLISSKIEKAF